MTGTMNEPAALPRHPDPAHEPGSPAEAAASVIRSAAGAPPRIGIILGSGLGDVADAVVSPVVLDYAAVPGFPVPSVSGHSGRITLGSIEQVPVAVLQGRVHYYEHGDALGMDVPVRSLAAAGCDVLMLTNAAGTVHPGTPPGSLVAISDHINLTGANPLIGLNPHTEHDPSSRFVDMVDAYDPALRTQLGRAAARAKIPLGEGVYACFSGPSFETPAEIRAARVLGADVVGMSVVPEAIIARHCGLRVLALSVITNYAAGVGDEALGHQHTMDNAARASSLVGRLVRGFLAELASV